MVEFNPSTTIEIGKGQAKETGENDTESERVIVASRKINLTKAKLNMLAFEDIFRVGEDEMKKKNFMVSRLRRQKRKQRKLNIRKSIYEEEVSNDNQRSPTVQEFLKRAKSIEDKS